MLYQNGVPADPPSLKLIVLRTDRIRLLAAPHLCLAYFCRRSYEDLPNLSPRDGAALRGPQAFATADELIQCSKVDVVSPSFR